MQAVMLVMIMCCPPDPTEQDFVWLPSDSLAYDNFNRAQEALYELNDDPLHWDESPSDRMAVYKEQERLCIFWEALCKAHSGGMYEEDSWHDRYQTLRIVRDMCGYDEYYSGRMLPVIALRRK